MYIHNGDLTPLKPEECADVSPKSKSKQLVEAYKIAAEGHDLAFFKNMLGEHEAAIQQDIEAKEAKEAEKAEKAAKKKRKSEVKADDDVDMEDADDAEPKKSSKKRKKEVDEDDEDEKVSCAYLYMVYQI
jgi:hypothetical protein